MSQRSKIEKRANLFKNNDISSGAQKTSALVPILLMTPALLFFALYMFIPLFTMLSESFESHKVFGTNMGAVLQDDSWWNSVRYSFIYSITTLFVSLSLSLVLASILSGMVRTRLRGFWQTLFFIPYVTSVVAMSIVFSLIFDHEGGIVNELFNLDLPWLQIKAGEGWLTLFTMFLFGVWQSMAFQILILVTAMLAVDKRLYDAADIDGISKTKQLFNITIPQISKTINYLILVGLITCLKFFPMALFGNNSDIAMDYGPTMLMYIYTKAKSGGSMGQAAAASILMIIFITIFQLLVTFTLKLIGKIWTNYNGNKTKRALDHHIRMNNQYAREVGK